MVRVSWCRYRDATASGNIGAGQTCGIASIMVAKICGPVDRVEGSTELCCGKPVMKGKRVEGQVHKRKLYLE